MISVIAVCDRAPRPARTSWEPAGRARCRWGEERDPLRASVFPENSPWGGPAGTLCPPASPPGDTADRLPGFLSFLSPQAGAGQGPSGAKDTNRLRARGSPEKLCHQEERILDMFLRSRSRNLWSRARCPACGHPCAQVPSSCMRSGRTASHAVPAAPRSQSL